MLSLSKVFSWVSEVAWWVKEQTTQAWWAKFKSWNACKSRKRNRSVELSSDFASICALARGPPNPTMHTHTMIMKAKWGGKNLSSAEVRMSRGKLSEAFDYQCSYTFECFYACVYPTRIWGTVWGWSVYLSVFPKCPLLLCLLETSQTSLGRR